MLNPAVMVRRNFFTCFTARPATTTEHIIRLGLAKSEDGFHFVRCFDGPILSPDPDGPDAGGIEDPRLICMGDRYYLTYASRTYAPGQYWRQDWKPLFTPPEAGPRFAQKNNTLTHLAMSEDLIHYKKLGRITDSRVDNRDVLPFPEKIGGKFVQLFRPMEWTGKESDCKVPSIWPLFF